MILIRKSGRTQTSSHRYVAEYVGSRSVRSRASRKKAKPKRFPLIRDYGGFDFVGLSHTDRVKVVQDEARDGRKAS